MWHEFSNEQHRNQVHGGDTCADTANTRLGREQNATYEDWNVWVSSCFNSPLVLIVKMRMMGMPTARYAHTSWKS